MQSPGIALQPISSCPRLVVSPRFSSFLPVSHAPGHDWHQDTLTALCFLWGSAICLLVALLLLLFCQYVRPNTFISHSTPPVTCHLKMSLLYICFFWRPLISAGTTVVLHPVKLFSLLQITFCIVTFFFFLTLVPN